MTFIFWIIFSLLVGLYAKNKKNRSMLNWTLITMLISPLISFVIVAILDPL